MCTEESAVKVFMSHRTLRSPELIGQLFAREAQLEGVQAEARRRVLRRP